MSSGEKRKFHQISKSNGSAAEHTPAAAKSQDNHRLSIGEGTIKPTTGGALAHPAPPAHKSRDKHENAQRKKDGAAINSTKVEGKKVSTGSTSKIEVAKDLGKPSVKPEGTKPGYVSKSTKKDSKSFDADIDSLFATLKTQKAKAKEDAVVLAAKREKAEKKKAKIEEKIKELEREGLKSNRMKGPESPIPLRIDPDSGFPIYSIDQLKIGKGGGTELCPFDCDCCF